MTTPFSSISPITYFVKVKLYFLLVEYFLFIIFLDMLFNKLIFCSYNLRYKKGVVGWCDGAG